ncbi:MAG: alanine racemase [Oscillospiraceae bacterium]|nr:alanine racemase [Oscillospiraceae bacterium]
MDFLKRTWVQIRLDALAHNFRQIRRQVGPGCRIMAVVKADGYGHGDQQVSQVFQEEGADWFAVSNIEEAMHLRQGGIVKPILILGFTPADQAAQLCASRISQTVFSLDYARALSSQAAKAGVEVDCHIKLDTGMSRLGFLCDPAHFDRSMEEITETVALPGLACTGVFTHFACADEANEDSDRFTFEQFQRFQQGVAALEKKGVRFVLHHCCNSAATMRFPQMHLDMVRPGVILYGRNPTPDCAGLMDLIPAMDLKSTVAMVKQVGAGAQVSYGRTYTAPAGTVLATVPIGYADGYRRTHSNKAHMAVRGSLAPVVGTVCMDQLMLDVTRIPGVQPGDIVTVFGRDGGCCVPIEDLAQDEKSIHYEVMCLIGKRVPRVYLAQKGEKGEKNERAL